MWNKKKLGRDDMKAGRGRGWTWCIGSFLHLLLGCSILLCGCNGDHEGRTPQLSEVEACVPGIKYDSYRMEFGLEYRDKGSLTLLATCDQLEGTLSVNKGNTFVKPSYTYKGTGTIYRFQESGDVLYTLKFSSGPLEQSPCGSDDISLSLSLSAKKGSFYLVGGLTAYCGRNTYHGRPARVMRISGTLKSP